MIETKRAIEPLLMRQPRDRGECHKDASDRNAEQFQDVTLFVMSNFMREDGFQFRLAELARSVYRRARFFENVRTR